LDKFKKGASALGAGFMRGMRATRHFFKFKFRVSALTFGVIGAFVAVVAQVFFRFTPPDAYGICIVCHARDLVNVVMSNKFTWYAAPASDMAVFKGLVFTIPGVLIGAALAAILSGEWKLRFAENPLVSLCLGFVVMCCGLTISGCPMRILLRAAYLDEGALLAIPFLVAGIFLATMFLKRRARGSKLR